VKLQEGEVRLSNEKVFVVAVIANECEPFRAAREVVAEVANGPVAYTDILADQEFRAVLISLP
jgi:hypothetical protein